MVTTSGADNTVPKGSPLTVTFGARDKWKFTPASRLFYSTRLDQQDWQPFQEARTVTLLRIDPRRTFFSGPEHGPQLEQGSRARQV